jgi:hypothetical protein
MREFYIKYNPVFPLIILAFGIIIFIAGLILSPIYMLTGALFIILPILMLTKPIIILTEDEIQIKNMVGMTMKRYPYNADEIEIKGKSIRLNGKKILTGFIGKK